MQEPKIVQGGMGVGVSNWRLANAVSKLGQLGVVSGTVLDTVLARRLQLGDLAGHMRRALDAFPIPGMAQRVLERYFIPGGKTPDAPFKAVPMFTTNPSREHQELTVVANFVEVFLAKEGHDNPVGINLLEKIQLPTLLSLYGALLAGVGYVMMGAGIPREIPGILDQLVQHQAVSLKLHVEGAASGDDFRMHFDPKEFIAESLPVLVRPKFVAIVASSTLAMHLTKKSTGRVDGFVVEGPTAGGHNAPPRGPLQLNDAGEPVYGAKDEVDLTKMCELDVPFWLAGSYGHAGKLQEALAAGAAGVQVGTLFAFCEESGLDITIKSRVMEQVREGRVEVFTDPYVSASGFPFKVLQLEDTMSSSEMMSARSRLCDLGYLRTVYKQDDGVLGFRCPGEPVEQYVRKGGKADEACGRKCLCNGLLSAITLPQRQRSGYVEPPIVTAGDDVISIARLCVGGRQIYTAADVIHDLLETHATT
jgi:nitronate monooxygenase